jgi:Kelch motif
VAALGGQIFIVGGAVSDTSLVRVYNPQTDSFSDAAPMPTPRELRSALLTSSRDARRPRTSVVSSDLGFRGGAEGI